MIALSNHIVKFFEYKGKHGYRCVCSKSEHGFKDHRTARYFAAQHLGEKIMEVA